MNASLPYWVQITQALAVPAIALAGIVVAAANLWLARKKRDDDLYDRKFELYSDCAQYVANYPSKDGTYNGPFLASILARARIIFGKSFSEKLWDMINPDKLKSTTPQKLHALLATLFIHGMKK